MKRHIRRGRIPSAPTRPLLVWAARFGYAACGIVYSAIGLAAVAVAIGTSAEPTGSHGVMIFLSRQPFGPILLAALGVGLAGYAALNLVGAISDPERRGVTLFAMVARAADVLTGVLYITLAVAALGIVIDPARDASNIVVTWAAGVLALPFGTVILGAIGAALMVSGAYLFYRSSQEPFGEMLDRRELSHRTRKGIALAARAGTAARALIFMICGWFVIRAATADSAEAVGDVGDALATIERAAFGPLLLSVVGAGFIAYGAYQLAKARYQRINSAVTRDLR